MFVILVVSLVALLFWLEWRMRQQAAYRIAKQLPGPPIYPLIGNMPDALTLNEANAHSYLRRKAITYGRAYRFYAFGYLHYWPIRCHEVEFMFSSTSHSCNDKSFIYRFLEPMLGCGLLCSKSTKWTHRRKVLTPAFHFNILQKFLHTFKEESNALIAKIADDKKAAMPMGTGIGDMISRFTLNNICETAMGVKLSNTSQPDQYRGMINRCGKLILERLMNPVLYYDRLFALTWTHRELLKCVQHLHDFSGSVIADRRRAYRGGITGSVPNEKCSEKRRYAMLDTLLEAEQADQMDEAGIREEVDTFMFEGYDTTSSGLMFCFFTIGSHQDVQHKIHAEICEIVDSHCGGDRTALGIHHYSRMQYMDQVIKETFRLYPPVPYISRNLSAPVDVGDVTLPADTQVHLMIYNLHRDPAQFDDPERFDPDRFEPERAERRHPFAYVPFSAGTRNCIGQKYALLEIKVLLTQLLLTYRLETVTQLAELALRMDMVLRTEKPIRVRFLTREIGTG